MSRPLSAVSASLDAISKADAAMPPAATWRPARDVDHQRKDHRGLYARG